MPPEKDWTHFELDDVQLCPEPTEQQKMNKGMLPRRLSHKVEMIYINLCLGKTCPYHHKHETSGSL
jgi:hypothetical protein